ncbi:MAG: hypothetical protein IJ153_11090 [Clostridia bacterium]|nr:hypothetical protein [Clostridia bacterium]MBQ9212232.1 hypothetical protein [Clostridia bacterium]
MRREERNDKPRMCDPGMCTFCQYIGDGDMVCTNPKVTDREAAVLVVEDWQQNENALACRRLGRRGGWRHGRQNKD